MRKYRKPYRLKKKRYFWQNRFFWLGILILIIFGGIFYLIFFSSLFQIKNIEISGNQKISEEDLKSLIEKKINQKILFLPSKSIFLMNFKETQKEILEKFPQIEKLNLKRKFPQTLFVQIDERKPLAIFCQNDNYFFVDRAGIAFERTEIKDGFPKLKKEKTREINLGEKVFNEEELSKILEVEAKLKNEMKIPLEEILIVSEQRFNVKTLEGWEIYFNFKEDLIWQLTKLKAVLDKEIPQEKRKNLEYIDVRFGNFAPYKYRQSSM